MYATRQGAAQHACVVRMGRQARSCSSCWKRLYVHPRPINLAPWCAHGRCVPNDGCCYPQRQRGGGSAVSPARPPLSVATPTRQAGNSSTAATNGDGPTHAVHADAGASSQAVNVPCLTADQPSLTADQPSGAGARQPTTSSGSPAVDGDAGAFAAPVGGAAAGDQPHNNASATEVEQAATTATNEAAGASDPGVDVGSDIAGRSTLPGPQALAAKQSNGQTPSPRMAQLRPHPLSIPAPRADATQTHRRGDTDVSPIPQSHQPGRGRLGWSLVPVAVGVVVVAAAAVVVMRRRR